MIIISKPSVADPGRLSRIPDPIFPFGIPNPIFPIRDHGPRVDKNHKIQEFKYFLPKKTQK